MKFIQALLISFVLGFFFSAYASENIVNMAKTTLKLNENTSDYLVKKEVLEKLADIKEYIQADLKNGNKNARVDVYLLLDGLVQNNLSSLQSFLATQDKNLFAKEFSDSINLDYAEKLAYALKENKHLLITEYIISSVGKKSQCENYVNGVKISNNKSFFAPAGLSYYIATYCEDNTFSANKIQSENAQPKYVISFNHYQEKQNLHFQPKIGQSEVKIPENNNRPKSYEENNFFISASLGYNYFFGEIKNENISNVGLNYGSLIYSKASLQYQNLFVAVDYTELNRDVIFYQDIVSANAQNLQNKITVKTTQSQRGYFLRPQAGIKKIFYTFSNNTTFSSSVYTSITFIKTQKGDDGTPGQQPYSQTFAGIGIAPQLNFNLGHNFIFNIGACLGVDFPKQKPQFLLGSELGFGSIF